MIVKIWPLIYSEGMKNAVEGKSGEFDRKDFDHVIGNLLRTPPLRKNALGTSRANKVKRVLPDRSESHQPKRERGDAV